MGAYFFYSDYVYNDGKWASKCLQIENGTFTRNIADLYEAFEMDVSNFWVGPGKVYVDVEEPVYDQLEYQSIASKYMYRGCTLLLCQLPIKSKTIYKQSFYQFKKSLSGLPIDHMVVPRIPISILQYEHIRFFGRNKVPFIILALDEIDDLYKVKWEWIEQAQSFSRMPLAIDIKNLKTNQKNPMRLWNQLCESYDVRALHEEITELPLTKDSLQLTGISPMKGELIQNGSSDYNLFALDKIPSIDEQTKFRYHKAIPQVTVMNGKVIKCNHLVEGTRGDGNYKQVSIPSHFVPI